jgi:hypothetical protein
MGESPGRKAQYYFGRRLARQVDYFAFPRTGSHFLRYCTQGLFDLVAFEHPDLEHEEALSRQAELDPCALYALDLREDGVPFAPVQINAQVTGRHGAPKEGGERVLVLIRDPMSTVYSLHRVMTTRWKPERRIGDLPAWIGGQLEQYGAFYSKAFDVIRASGSRGMLIRYEELVESSEPLEQLVALVGVAPKLTPAFVHWATRFDRFVREGERTFYRAGDNDAWRRDEAWCEALARAPRPDLSAFGYGAS